MNNVVGSMRNCSSIVRSEVLYRRLSDGADEKITWANQSNQLRHENPRHAGVRLPVNIKERGSIEENFLPLNTACENALNCIKSFKIYYNIARVTFRFVWKILGYEK